MSFDVLLFSFILIAINLYDFINLFFIPLFGDGFWEII